MNSNIYLVVINNQNSKCKHKVIFNIVIVSYVIVNSNSLFCDY